MSQKFHKFSYASSWAAPSHECGFPLYRLPPSESRALGEFGTTTFTVPRSVTRNHFVEVTSLKPGKRTLRLNRWHPWKYTTSLLKDLKMILKVHGTERGGSLWPSRSHHQQRDTPTLSTTSILEKFLNPSLSLLRRGSLAMCSEYASFASPNLPKSCSNTAFQRYLCQVASRLFRNKLNFLAVVFLSFPPGACRKAYSNMRIRRMWWTLADSDIYLLLQRGDSDSEPETSAKMQNVSWGAGFFFKPPMNAQALAHSDGLDIKWLQKQQGASKMRVWMGLWVDGHVCTLSQS